MKKIICILSFITFFSNAAFSQILFNKYRNYTDDLQKKSLDFLIKKAHYIFDITPIYSGESYLCDTFYVNEENQIYFRCFVKVNFVYKGKGIHEGDTVLYIFKQSGVGDQIFTTYDNIYYPYLFPMIGKVPQESCLLLAESTYPKKNNDEWAGKKQLAFIKTDVGYFGGNYNIECCPPVAVDLHGMEFLKRSDWYDYLKKFPGIKVPEAKKE